MFETLGQRQPTQDKQSLGAYYAATSTRVDNPMLKAILWTVIIVAALITGLGFAAARKSTGMPAPAAGDNGELPPCSNTPNCVSTEVDSQHPAYIEPIEARITIEQAQGYLENLGGQITGNSNNMLQAEFRTRLFGFTDDMMVKLNEADSTLRIRSSSRVGKSDLGANRKRVEALRQLISSKAN